MKEISPKDAFMYRPTDVAVSNNAGTLEIHDKKIPVVFATPRRALARLAKALRIKNTANIPMPYISVNRINETLDQTRFNYSSWRNLKYTEDKTAVLKGKHPVPYLFDYQIHFWTKYRWELQTLLEQYLRRFVPTYRQSVDFGQPWGIFECNTVQNGIEDMSELEPGEEAERKLHKVVAIQIGTWLMPVTEWVPTMIEGEIWFSGPVDLTGGDFPIPGEFQLPDTEEPAQEPITTFDGDVQVPGSGADAPPYYAGEEFVIWLERAIEEKELEASGEEVSAAEADEYLIEDP